MKLKLEICFVILFLCISLLISPMSQSLKPGIGDILENCVMLENSSRNSATTFLIR